MRRSFVAGALLATSLFWGCLTDSNPTDAEQGPKLFVAETDYMTGLLQWVFLGSMGLSGNSLSISSDPALKAHDGSLYILERYGADNILKFDPSKVDKDGVIYQQHLEDNANPVDLEITGPNKAYVSLQNTPYLLIIDPATGQSLDSIDIAEYSYAPESGPALEVPNANQMVLNDSLLYLALQRRNGWMVGGNTIVLVIDTKSDAVVDTIHFQYANNYDLAVAQNILYASNPGDLSTVGDGGIEAVDLSTNEHSVVITEDELGGNPNSIVQKQGSHFYVQNYVGYKDVGVKEVDFSNGQIVADLPNVKDAFGGIYYDDVSASLYVGDRDTTDMGVKIFKDNAQVGATIRTNLPPIGFAVVR